MATICFIFAHPDDETFATGGTIASYARNPAHTIHLICATRGEAGKCGDPPICQPAELGAVRAEELRRATQILGVDQLHLLPYHDKTLAQYPTEELAETLAQLCKEIEPTIIITFPPHGISGHPDHRAISAATTTMIQQGELPDLQRLFFVTVPHSVAALRSHSLHSDPDEEIAAIISFPDTVPLVAAAALQHRTQNMSMRRIFPGLEEGEYQGIPDRNYYLLAWTHPKTTPPWRKGEKPLHDLLVGLN